MQETILIVGGGTMGAGISFVAARAGYGVELVEPRKDARERALARFLKDAERAGDASIPQRIRFLEAIPVSSGAAIALEAVPERFEIKRDVLRALEAAVSPEAVIATNTSSLSVTELAGVLDHDERMIGIHFFNPPVAMRLVEIVPTQRTSDHVYERAHAFVERIGKTAVDASDTAGFIVNRVARPFYLQSMRALDLGVAGVPELDALARAAGFRMGPFELMDLIGLDVNYATSVSVYERLEAERLTPMEMQRRMVSEGRLGRKTSAGFYDYANGDPERLDLRAEALPEDEPNLEEVVAIIGFGGVADEMLERLEARFANVVHVSHDDMLDQLPEETTIVIDLGDGMSDRGDVLVHLEATLSPETMIFADAYATDVTAAAARMRHPERFVGYGVLGSLEAQEAVEIVDREEMSDDALALAQELFAALGSGIALVSDTPGLYLGRVVGSIVNEAVMVVHDGVADADDVDTAMRLGVNYPRGPVEWGREIGGRRLTRILQRIAAREGDAYAPHRALWVLDMETEEEPLEVSVDAGA